jgi:hypothetical protein
MEVENLLEVNYIQTKYIIISQKGPRDPIHRSKMLVLTPFIAP